MGRNSSSFNKKRSMACNWRSGLWCHEMVETSRWTNASQSLCWTGCECKNDEAIKKWHWILFFFFQEAFHAFHPEITRVQKYLKPFYIGDVSKDEDHIEEDQALKDELKKLKQKAISKVNRSLIYQFKIDYFF
jgi:hypothetical protein